MTHPQIRPLLSSCNYFVHIGLHVIASSSIIAFSLALGMIGYHVFEQLAWIDAFENAAMILSGMGPLESPKSFDGKLFAGCYALYSGLVLILAAGIIFTPFIHRVLNHFHRQKEGH